ncbi:NAD(P)-dependent dehydrogenase, short-chain alcohol dehydrogenase family [Collimonas sp. OK412]|jgi:NAD(P)-dependent dehydrogenase (short-subunit alcohol dehydrogenase family)|nr:NAD(P)-dependent dehydrogenase, short-chain alcohol dehydrogenase family [Collimonas sp. OK412]
MPIPDFLYDSNAAASAHCVTYRENSMKIDLSDKHAVVSGSTAGIGLAIALGLAQAGATVVVNGRTQERVDQALEQIRGKVPAARLQGIAADLGTADGAALLFKQVLETDILINNLGIFEAKPFFDITDEDWQRFFDVNVMSAVRLSRHYAPGMVKRGWGRVQFLSSESGLQIPKEMVHYGMTKTALLAVSRGLAETLAGSGVTVNAVLPGPTRSEGVGDFFASMARDQGIASEELERDFLKEHRPSSLIQRLATVEEVANMVVYLASVQASATTGAALRVDGGVVRSIS